MKRIGLLGGTFDPVHYGHLKPAMQAYELLALDEVLILPNHIPPHKAGTHASLEPCPTISHLIKQEPMPAWSSD